jgi:hypothetical protein
MRIIALITIASFFFFNTGDAQEHELRWTDEGTWPAYVQATYLEVNDGDDELLKLSKERRNASLRELRNRYTYWIQGTGELHQVAANADRLLAAALETEPTAADQLRLLRERFEFARVTEIQAEELAKLRRGARAFVDEEFGRYYRLHTQIEFLKAERAVEAVQQVE